MSSSLWVIFTPFGAAGRSHQAERLAQARFGTRDA
jgi:hypothetical protein